MSAEAKRAPARREWRIKKLARLAAYCFCVSTVAGGLAIRSAYGDVKDSMLALGHELGKLDGAGAESPILLNGQPIHVRSMVEDIALEDVLDTVEAYCERDAPGLRKELDDLASAARKPPPSEEEGNAGAGIIRREERGRGVVSCLARDDGGGGSGWERLQRFADTGDLSEVGNLRYVFVEETASGRAHIVTVWTEGPFNLRSMFPAKGDAPGSDPQSAPRPDGSRRILTATIEGAPYGVRIYQAEGAPEQALAPYDTQMAAKGWELVVSKPETHHRVYRKGDVDVIVGATPDRGGSTVSLVEISAK